MLRDSICVLKPKVARFGNVYHVYSWFNLFSSLPEAKTSIRSVASVSDEALSYISIFIDTDMNRTSVSHLQCHVYRQVCVCTSLRR